MKAKIFYFTLQDEQTKEEKLDWFERSRFEKIPFDHITPDQKANWINLTDNDFDSFLPLIDKEVKEGKSNQAVFVLFSRGIETTRDEWVYDFDQSNLELKIKFFIEKYNLSLRKGEHDLQIKWSSSLDEHLKNKIQLIFHSNRFARAVYRPYIRQNFYADKLLSHRLTQNHFEMFGDKLSKGNFVIWFKVGSAWDFFALTVDKPSDLLPQSGSQCLPLYRYDKDGNCVDNITDWALEQFRERYLPSPPQPSSPAGEEGERDVLPSPAVRGAGGEGLVQLAGARRVIPEALLQRARELRQQQTSAEKILWECLRANRLQGAKFRRQHTIGQYIVDFYCSAARLVVELDGEIHELQKDRDSDRDAWLQANGLTVLRVKNEDVIQNTEHVLQAIASYLPSPAGEGQGVREITKQDIFHYTYAVLHHPAYRIKYELNLKREFPRLPFYADFHQWAAWGNALMDLHLNYETIEPYGLNRVDIPTTRLKGRSRQDIGEQQTIFDRGGSSRDFNESQSTPGQDPPLQNPSDIPKPTKRTTPKPKLKADKIEGKIILDTETTLEGVPAIAWDYKLGNRSALEWILDQYKEKKPKDPTIAKLFNTYRFADYKEQVIDLLQRVCTVSVRTMEIIQQMPAE